MDADTITRLNAINREFYRLTAEEFDLTRGQAWQGWEKILPHLARIIDYRRGVQGNLRLHNAPTNPVTLSVLDVGCGNGRFGVFLAQRLNVALHYHGVDNNPALLEKAKTALAGLAEVTLEERDIVANPPDGGHYDLVAAFGLLHHIPGGEQRLTFMQALAARVAEGGLLVFACWRFYEYEQWRARIVPFPADLAGKTEKHDYLLDWRRGTTALRYCHYVDDEEHARLVAAAGLTEIAAYRADGQGNAMNRYSLLKLATSRSP
jgi:SAM-dependent methyltransferase